MKILFLSRKTLFSVFGGDTVQVLKTAEALRRKGVLVDVSTELEPDLCGYDLVHVFNLTRPQETALQVAHAKKRGCPIALSTIYLNYEEYERKARGGMVQKMAQRLSGGQIEYLKILGRAVKNAEFHKGTIAFFLQGYEKSLREICAMTDVFLPNSRSEMDRLVRDLKLEISQPVCPVPNAVDVETFSAKKTGVPRWMERFKGCILCVARIEGKKNQLNLVRATRKTNHPLVLIGDVAPNHKKYLESIKREAGANVTILDHVPMEELPAWYSLCKVHALVSWMETTGLSSLEAAAMGANLVITDRGDTKEYFLDQAFYCEPDDTESIQKALAEALAAPVSQQLQSRVIRDYTWDKTAEKTLEGYKLAFARN